MLENAQTKHLKEHRTCFIKGLINLQITTKLEDWNCKVKFLVSYIDLDVEDSECWFLNLLTKFA